MLPYASICTWAVWHNPLTGNKKPRNRGFRGVSQDGLFLTSGKGRPALASRPKAVVGLTGTAVGRRSYPAAVSCCSRRLGASRVA